MFGGAEPCPPRSGDASQARGYFLGHVPSPGPAKTATHDCMWPHFTATNQRSAADVAEAPFSSQRCRDERRCKRQPPRWAKLLEVVPGIVA